MSPTPPSELLSERLHIMVSATMKSQIDELVRLDPRFKSEAAAVRHVLMQNLDDMIGKARAALRDLSAPVPDITFRDEPDGEAVKPRIFGSPVQVSRDILQPKVDPVGVTYDQTQSLLRQGTFGVSERAYRAQ